MADQVRDTLLQDSSYHIEFNSYLTNHVKHAVVALHGLQAPAATIQRYWDQYTAVTPYGYHLEPARAPTAALTAAGYRQLLGHKERYPDLLSFFDSQVQENGMDSVLAEYMPHLIQGAAAALTHGIIHLGWGLDGQSRWMTIEGLAYMAYTFVDIHPERFASAAHADATPVDTLLRVAAAYHAGAKAEVRAIMRDPQLAADSFHPELYDAGFQWKLAKVLECGHPLFLELPAWLLSMPVAAALREMYKSVALLYVTLAGAPGERRAGNFVVLHLITSLWGADQVVRRLPEAQHGHAMRCFWASAVAVVASSGAGFPSADCLQQARDHYKSVHDADEHPGGGGTAGVRSWPEIVERACEEQEEHNIKLVYVCRELWRRYGRWHGFRVAADTFTTTPSIGPGKAAFKS